MRCSAVQFLLSIRFYQYITVLHQVSQRGIILTMTWSWFCKDNSSTKLVLKATESKITASEFRQLSGDAWEWRLGSWVRHCCHQLPVLHVCGGFMLTVQSSMVHSKVEFCSHQCLTLEVLQACKGLLSTVTFSRKVKFGI